MDGDCRATYRPCNSTVQPSATVAQPPDLQQVLQRANIPVSGPGGVGLSSTPPELQQQATRVARFKELANTGEHQRLHAALMNEFGT